MLFALVRRTTSLIDARFTYLLLLLLWIVKERVTDFYKTGQIYIYQFCQLVETTGIEPVTSSLQSWRSPN